TSQPYPLSLHDALPICSMTVCAGPAAGRAALTASVPRGNSRAETIPASTAHAHPRRVLSFLQLLVWAAAGRCPLNTSAVAILRTGLVRTAAELLQEFVALMCAVGILSHHLFEEFSDLVFACVTRVAHVLAVVVASLQRVVLHRD